MAPFLSWLIAGHRVLYPETPGKFPSSVIHKEELQGAAHFQGKRQLMNFHCMRRCRYRSKAVPQSVDKCRRQSLHLLLPAAKLEKEALVSLTFSGRLSQWIKHGRPREAKAFGLNLKNKQPSRPFVQLFKLQFFYQKSNMASELLNTLSIQLISEYFTVEEKWFLLGCSHDQRCYAHIKRNLPMKGNYESIDNSVYIRNTIWTMMTTAKNASLQCLSVHVKCFKYTQSN